MHYAHAMPMISVRKIQSGWAREFSNLGKNSYEFLKHGKIRLKEAMDCWATHDARCSAPRSHPGDLRATLVQPDF